jgi:hypothetical protein
LILCVAALPLSLAAQDDVPQSNLHIFPGGGRGSAQSPPQHTPLPTPTHPAAKATPPPLKLTPALPADLTPPNPLPAIPPPPPPVVPTNPGARPAQMAVVRYEHSKLTVEANNSSLNQILRAIMHATGMQVTGGVTDERVFGAYGPDSTQVVLSKLLDGTATNIIYTPGSKDQPPQLVLTARGGGALLPGPEASAGEEASMLPPPTNAPPEPLPATVSLQAPPSTPASASPFAPLVAAPAAPAASATAPQPSTPANSNPVNVKTPDQILEEILKLRQQQPKSSAPSSTAPTPQAVQTPPAKPQTLPAIAPLAAKAPAPAPLPPAVRPAPTKTPEEVLQEILKNRNQQSNPPAPPAHPASTPPPASSVATPGNPAAIKATVPPPAPAAPADKPISMKTPEQIVQEILKNRDLRNQPPAQPNPAPAAPSAQPAPAQASQSPTPQAETK